MDELELKFKELLKQWKDETKTSSFVSKMTSTKSYKDIIDLGPSVIPLLLKELQTNPNWYFDALRILSNEDPHKAGHEGKLIDLANDWIEWGKKKKYIK